MGEDLTPFWAEFNGSLRIESRAERLTSEAGAIILREVVERLGIVPWMVERLRDPRNPRLVTHPLEELLHTAVLLIAQGWRDRDDADALRDDAALRLAVSTRRGISPLLNPEREEGEAPSKNPLAPEGLASQPTLSRLVRELAANEENRSVLRESLLETAARRVKASRDGHRMRYASIDVDSLPIDVHGRQPGSEYNGHYHSRIYHPIVASLAETGDLVDLRLREGNVHSAEGALDFVLSVVERVEKKLCQVASVRMDAGFPEEKLLAGIEARGTPYVARERNNAVLNRMAEPYLVRPVGRPPKEPRTWFHEMSYQAEKWSRPRRVVLVVMERQGELFLHHFWLITNWSKEQMAAEALLELYRERGTAEGYYGELKSVLDPALSSSPRQKSHYRGEVPQKRTAPGDAFAQNEVILLLNALAYNVAHAARVLMEAATGEGWSLIRMRERVLRVAARILVHGRRATIIIGKTSAALWHGLWSQLIVWRYAGP
ncbi:MAG TPA: IS1380 family transposase [Anaeromyxobacteraceae bacterium]|nr:IS1380 family transposase [Anaeromyxobacteraceae bacterium]